MKFSGSKAYEEERRSTFLLKTAWKMYVPVWGLSPSQTTLRPTCPFGGLVPRKQRLGLRNKLVE